MLSIKKIRASAKDICLNASGKLILLSIIYLFIFYVQYYVLYYVYDYFTPIKNFELLLFNILLVLLVLLSVGFSYSWVYISQYTFHGFELKIGTLFKGFDIYGKAFMSSLLQYIYIIGWSLISFGIVGIIKAFSYSLTSYILVENPSVSANEAIALSRKVMKGRKWKLFCLLFSYFFDYLLCVLTFGVLTIWVIPRVSEAMYIFYRESVIEYKKNKEVSLC